MFILIVLLYFLQNKKKVDHIYASRYLFSAFKRNQICITLYQALKREMFSIFLRLALKFRNHDFNKHAPYKNLVGA